LRAGFASDPPLEVVDRPDEPPFEVSDFFPSEPDPEPESELEPAPESDEELEPDPESEAELFAFERLSVA
jgi:hypothetical protein